MYENISVAISLLKQGGIIAYPTEAVYGLGCDSFNQTAVLQLLNLKQRPLDKGLILLAADLSQIAPYIDTARVPSDRLQQIYSTWPGPFTWVFPATDKVPAWIRGNHDTFAARVTAHPVARALCAALNYPLVSTSANLTGQMPAYNAMEVKKMFPTGVAYIVEGEIGHLNKPTIIRDAISGTVIRA